MKGRHLFLQEPILALLGKQIQKRPVDDPFAGLIFCHDINQITLTADMQRGTPCFVPSVFYLSSLLRFCPKPSRTSPLQAPAVRHFCPRDARTL